MNESHSRAIVWLLAAILVVLLFGANRVWAAAEIVLWIAIPLVVLWGVFLLLRKGAAGVWTEIQLERNSGGPWRSLAVAWFGIALNFVTVAVAVFDYLANGTSIREAINGPFAYATVGLLGVAAIVFVFERRGLAIDAFGRMARGWLTISVSPITAPIGTWRRLSTQRKAGEGGSIAGAIFSAAGSFVLACLAWWFLVALPLLAIFVVSLEAFSRP